MLSPLRRSSVQAYLDGHTMGEPWGRGRLIKQFAENDANKKHL